MYCVVPDHTIGYSCIQSHGHMTEHGEIESSLTAVSPPPSDLAVSVVGLERALLQYCSQPQDNPFDMKTVPIETVPLGTAKCENTVFFFFCLFLFAYLFVCLFVCCVISAMGEATPGASVQKAGGVAASKQDVYAGKYHMTIM